MSFTAPLINRSYEIIDAFVLRPEIYTLKEGVQVQGLHALFFSQLQNPLQGRLLLRSPLVVQGIWLLVCG